MSPNLRRIALFGLVAGSLVVLGRWVVGSDGGIARPCVDPIEWRLGRVDAEFNLPADRVRDAVNAAIAEWESSTGRRLFRHDSVHGMPIELVYDERQAASDSARLHRRRIDRAGAALVDGERLYAAQEQEHAREVETLRRRAEELDGRVRSLNAEAARWNERGGVPPPEWQRLQRSGDEVRAEQSSLNRQARDLEDRRRRLDRDLARLQQAADEYNALVSEYGQRYVGRVESGTFRQTVVTRRGRPVRIERSLTIYNFDGFDELVLILTHELGHALGLEHVPDRAAVMFEAYTSGIVDGRVKLHRSDLAALAQLCGFAAAEADA